DTVADREASGTASVWRFAPGTVRRALDAGRTADDIVTELGAIAVDGLPQALSYLIHDTARGHGRVRIAPAACVIHGEEPALLTELAAHRKLAALGLWHLAPGTWHLAPGTWHLAPGTDGAGQPGATRQDPRRAPGHGLRPSRRGRRRNRTHRTDP